MGNATNDVGNATFSDVDTAVGDVVTKVALYWHCGVNRVEAPKMTPGQAYALCDAAVNGDDEALDIAGLDLWPEWWADEVVDRSVTIPSGEIISCREAARRALVALTVPAVAL